jgi:hypothetical protein
VRSSIQIGVLLDLQVEFGKLIVPYFEMLMLVACSYLELNSETMNPSRYFSRTPWT